MHCPLITVIIPAYCPDFLEAAIASVERQTYDHWELLVIDDDSPSGQVAPICATHPRAQYFWQKNGGPSAARNHGISLAKGELIAFLDDDDVWLPEKLQRQVDAYLSAPDRTMVGLVYTGQYQLIGTERKGGKVDSAKGMLYPHLLFGNFVGTCSSILVPSAVFQAVGIFNQSLICAQDFDLYLRIARRFELISVDEPLIEYRLRAGQITGDPRLNTEDDTRILDAQSEHAPVGLLKEAKRFARRMGFIRYQRAAYAHLFEKGSVTQYSKLLLAGSWRNRWAPTPASLAYLSFALLPRRVAMRYAQRRRSAQPATSSQLIVFQEVRSKDYRWAGCLRGDYPNHVWPQN